MTASALAYPYLLTRAALAARRSGPGGAFDRFGRTLGARLLLRGWRYGAVLLLHPVDSVRYFEFPFALSCCPDPPRRCLDVGSPRLFSLYLAQRHPQAEIRMINPDAADLGISARIARMLRMSNLTFDSRGADAASAEGGRYDCIWSISVVEHVAGRYQDVEAVRWMYGALADGGRLILTVPVDRAFREEFRDRPQYGTQPPAAGRYFFQRVYDRAAIWDRLVEAVGREPDRVAWFGERAAGRFAAYQQRWLERGLAATVDDPKEIAEHYTTFPSWETMPGQGVCGLMFEKPARGAR